MSYDTGSNQGRNHDEPSPGEETFWFIVACYTPVVCFMLGFFVRSLWK